MLRSHEPSVVDDLTAALELAEGPLPATDGVGAVIEDTDKAGEERRAFSAGSAGNGALLVHGPPGVGKTRLVKGRERERDSLISCIRSRKSLLRSFAHSV